MEVLRYRPEPAELAWTFGGVRPVRTVRPGAVLELWTEDCFGGRVRGPGDLVDPNYTFVSKLRKDYLPAREAYGGAHRRLRELGRAYLAERR